MFINDLPNLKSMKTVLFADGTVLVQSENNLEKLQNSINREMTEVMDWLTANKFSLDIFKTTYMLITNKHVSTESFAINANGNCIERTLTYKYLGVIVDDKPTWKEHGKQLCCTVLYPLMLVQCIKLNYVNNKKVRMLYHSLINS